MKGFYFNLSVVRYLGFLDDGKTKKIICKINCIGNYVVLIKVIKKGSFDDMRKYVNAVFQNFVKYLFDIKTNIGIIMST